MKAYCKYLAASLIALLLSLGCAVASVLSLPNCYTKVMPENAVSRIEDVVFDYGDCVMLPGGAVNADGVHPWVRFDGVGGWAASVCVRLQEPMIPGTYYRFYYVPAGEELDEAHSIAGLTTRYQTELLFSLEPGSYDYYRLDVGGDYLLADFLISQDAPDIEAVGRFSKLLQGDFSDFNVRQWMLCFAILWSEAMLIAWKWSRIRAWFAQKRSCYQEHKSRFWIGAALLLGCTAAGTAVWAVLCCLNVLTASFYSCVYFAAAGMALGWMLALRRQAGAHPERLFFALILCAGMVLALILPRATIVSWDDETHYKRALNLSYFGYTYLTEADHQMVMQAVPVSMDLEETEAIYAQLNQQYDAGTDEGIPTDIRSLVQFTYLPMAAGMWLARVAGLPFTAIFTAGRIGNLVCYAAVLYFAMKRLKGNGVLIGVFALIPTMLFLAANYSYDGWCVAFLALGTAIFLDEYQHPERPFQWGAAVRMLLALTVGCIPKAIYFPIFLMCLFLPKEKFSSDRQRRCYRLLVVGVTFLVAMSFVAPFLFSGGANKTDIRGGGDVSGAGQLSYVLADPIGYLGLLFRFLFTEYFTPVMIKSNAVVAFAYLGQVGFGTWFLAVLAVVFFLDRSREDGALRRPAWSVKLAALVSFFCSVCLAATAMYIAFTAVGAGTISGCQERYMMPVLLPMLMQVRPNRTWVPIPQNWYCMGVAAAEGALVFACFWPLMAAYV